MPFISMVVGGVEMFLSLMLLLLLVPTASLLLLLPFDLDFEEADDDDVATALNGRFLFAVLNIISSHIQRWRFTRQALVIGPRRRLVAGHGR